jgi:pimeloyl-ACP methyl ester carboxylesterase
MAEIWKTPEAGEAVLARYARFLSHWPQPSEQLRLPTSQGETFVIASGRADAPPVVLLHGAVANSTSWLGDAAAWSQHFRVYAVDVIGEPGFSAPSRPDLASDAYAVWLDEVLAGLGVVRCAFVGISLGGWLALDYATRRPERVSALALLCPGGVGAQKNLAWVLPLLLLGKWGRTQVMRRLGGAAVTRAGEPSAALKAFAEFQDEITARFRPRRVRLPRFADAALRRLTMPALFVLGARDAILDSAGTRTRVARLMPHVEIVWLPDEGHFLVRHGPTLGAFLQRALGS